MTKPAPKEIVVLGGGAAGYFAAITAAHAHPKSPVTILERSAHLLAKVKISGGGRCNVTHACYDPAELITHYPRGGAALRGPFTRFQPRDTVEWFESRGVPLKTEEDGRIFPQSDRSESIIECLQTEAQKAGVTVRINAFIHKIHKKGPAFEIELGAETMRCDRLILATGSGPQGWEWARALGHTIVPPVPSLFTFTIPDSRLLDLAGISMPKAIVAIKSEPWKFQGPVLITHEGLSGPAVLRLSAWAARALHERQYQADLIVNWTGEKVGVCDSDVLEGG